MSLTQILQDSGIIDSMARELSVDPATAKKATGALLPAIVAGMGRTTTQAAPAGGGLGQVIGGITGGGSGASGGDLGGLGQILLDQVLRKDPTPTRSGNDILGQIFGSKDVSRGVVEEAAGSTGLPAELLKKMLPILAMAVLGHMMKGNSGGARGGGAGALDGALGGILGQVVTGMLRR